MSRRENGASVPVPFHGRNMSISLQERVRIDRSFDKWCLRGKTERERETTPKYLRAARGGYKVTAVLVT